MGDLSDFLSKYNRSFPIGLSGKTGIGYILTGGISPLSRSRGLAIDQIVEISGFWGNGDKFQLKRPQANEKTSPEWRALCGAAAFLGIITKVKLKTQQLKPIVSWTANLTLSELSECIYQAESWPNYISLQWIWGESIFAYAIAEIQSDDNERKILNLLEKLPFTSNRKINKVFDIKYLPKLSLENNNFNNFCYSEVLGLLGPSWQNKNPKVVKIIRDLLHKRPNKNCYIASQQLGGKSLFDDVESSFIHRYSFWKPWINGSWPANNQKEREKSLIWMEECWAQLEFICPGVHLAQLHNHLPWHKKEIALAFKDWLKELKEIKSKYDPDNIMPSL